MKRAQRMVACAIFVSCAYTLCMYHMHTRAFFSVARSYPNVWNARAPFPKSCNTSGFSGAGGVTSTKHAFVTLSSAHHYWKASLALVVGVRCVGNSWERFLVMIPRGNGELTEGQIGMFERWNSEIVYIDPTPVPATVHISNARWAFSWNKLHAFLLTKWDKLVYLDSDIIVNNDISEIFDFPTTSSAPGQCTPCETNHGLNAGVMILKPSLDVYDGLISMASGERPHGWSGADQSLLGEYYEKHAASGTGERLKLISGLYNTAPQSCACLPEVLQKDHVKMWHFMCSQKPWSTPKHVLSQEEGCVSSISLRFHEMLNFVGINETYW